MLRKKLARQETVIVHSSVKDGNADYEIINSEEDGVNNESVDNNALYTQPEDIYQIYKTLSPISPYFSIAAGFGNVHGVWVKTLPHHRLSS